MTKKFIFAFIAMIMLTGISFANERNSSVENKGSASVNINDDIKRYAVIIHLGPLGTVGFDFEWGDKILNGGDNSSPVELNGTIENGKLVIFNDAAFKKAFGSVKEIYFPGCTIAPTEGYNSSIKSITVSKDSKYAVEGPKIIITNSTGKM